LILLPFVLFIACDRPIGPSQAGDPGAAGAAAEAPADPVALSVNGLTLTRAELDRRVPATADAGIRRAAQDATVDLLLAASEARRLEAYRTLPPLEAGERFLVDQFASERFCEALPEAELERFYRAHRTRYVHPDHHVLAALYAAPGAHAGDLAAALDEALAADLPDALRQGADAFDALSLRWEAACRALGATASAELWTFFSVPDHAERTPPARRHPEDTPALVALVEGERSPAWGADDGVRLYVKLEGHPAARRELRDPEVLADVRRRACDEHRQEARRRFLDELRRAATLVLTPDEPSSGARSSPP